MRLPDEFLRRQEAKMQEYYQKGLKLGRGEGLVGGVLAGLFVGVLTGLLIGWFIWGKR